MTIMTFQVSIDTKDSSQALDTTTQNSPSRWCRCCLRCFDNEEAVAWALDSTGRTVSVVGLGAFMAPALLTLARQAAGCSSDTEQECTNTIHGIRPSSLFTIVQTLVGVCAAPLLPLWGAVIDRTSYRLCSGRILSAIFAAFIAAMIAVQDDTWWPLTIVFLVTFIIFMFQMVLGYSYLPELTSNEAKLRLWTKNFSMITFSSTVIYVVIVVAIGGGLHLLDDATAVARVSQSLSFVICASTLGVAWGKLFRPRPPASQSSVPVWKEGFLQIVSTGKKIARQYHSLCWFFGAISVTDSSIHALTAIMITFFVDQVGLNSMEIGIAVVVMLLFSIPGGWVSAKVTKCTNPIHSSVLSLVLLIINTAVAAAVLTGPNQKNLVYLFVAIWGFTTIWKWTCDRMLVSMIVPEGQSSEIMGFYLFSGYILMWAPPLVFTSLNEAGISQRIGLSSLNVWFLLGILFYCLMGSYDAAVGTAGKSTAANLESEIAQRAQAKGSNVEEVTHMEPLTTLP